MANRIRTAYHDLLFDADKFQKLMRRTADCINALVRCRRRDRKPEALVATGVSGLVAGGALSEMTGLPLCVVRKEETQSHSSFTVEGPVVDRYLIVDDRVESGTTLCRVIDEMTRFRHPRYPEIIPQCTGIVFYHPLAASFDHSLTDAAIISIGKLPIYTPTSRHSSRARLSKNEMRLLPWSKYQLADDDSWRWTY